MGSVGGIVVFEHDGFHGVGPRLLLALGFAENAYFLKEEEGRGRGGRVSNLKSSEMAKFAIGIVWKIKNCRAPSPGAQFLAPPNHPSGFGTHPK